MQTVGRSDREDLLVEMNILLTPVFSGPCGKGAKVKKRNSK